MLQFELYEKSVSFSLPSSSHLLNAFKLLALFFCHLVVTANMIVAHFSCGAVHFEGRDFRLLDTVSLSSPYPNYLIATIRGLTGGWGLQGVKPRVVLSILAALIIIGFSRVRLLPVCCSVGAGSSLGLHKLLRHHTSSIR